MLPRQAIACGHIQEATDSGAAKPRLGSSHRSANAELLQVHGPFAVYQAPGFRNSRLSPVAVPFESSKENLTRRNL